MSKNRNIETDCLRHAVLLLVASHLPWFPALWYRHFQAQTRTREPFPPEGHSAWPALQIHTEAAACPSGRMRTFLQEQVSDLTRKSNERRCYFRGCPLNGTCGLQGSPDFPTYLNLLQNLGELLSLGGIKTDGTKQTVFGSIVAP